MKGERIKTILLRVLGYRLMAYVHAVRFVYLIKIKRKPDREAVLLEHILKPDDVVVDVGANGGNWTYHLHRHVGRCGRVFAFEADPYYACATRIALNLMILRGVRFFSFGLSDKNEKLCLRVHDSNGIRYAGRGFIDRNADPEEKGIEVVELRRLDSMTDEYPDLLRTAFVKCDAEGFELYIFKGANEVLEKARPVVVLEAGDNMRGYSAEDLHGYFEERRYLAFAMTRDGRLDRTDASFRCNGSVGANRVLIPEEKMDQFNGVLFADSNVRGER